MLNVFTLDKGRLSGRLLQEEIDSAADLAQVPTGYIGSFSVYAWLCVEEEIHQAARRHRLARQRAGRHPDGAAPMPQLPLVR